MSILNRATFSGYWKVEGNVKPTNGRHLRGAKKLNIDNFFSEEKIDFSNNIKLNFKDLPSKPYLKNLTKYCESMDYVYTKYGLRIKSSSYLKLATIWTSKILLFKRVSDLSLVKDIVWRDCVFNRGFGEILNGGLEKKMVIKKYHSIPGNPYGGLLEAKFPKIKLKAGALRLPVEIIKEFEEKYIECLKEVDRVFNIYDEELVLSFMNEKHSELFSIK